MDAKPSSPCCPSSCSPGPCLKRISRPQYRREVYGHSRSRWHSEGMGLSQLEGCCEDMERTRRERNTRLESEGRLGCSHWRQCQCTCSRLEVLAYSIHIFASHRSTRSRRSRHHLPQSFLHRSTSPTPFRTALSLLSVSAPSKISSPSATLPVSPASSSPAQANPTSTPPKPTPSRTKNNVGSAR